MVMHDPVIHRFISYLADRKNEQEQHPGMPLRIELSREFVESVRESFKQHILQGEQNLHTLSHLLASSLLGDTVELHSNVIGTLPGGENRPFLIRERITRESLFAHTDIDLGNHMLGRFRYQTDGEWNALELSANFVEYLPQEPSGTGVNRITSRVKAEEELWNKVTDELFNLDHLVRQDKHLRQLSKYIKDVFGIKIVSDDEATCLRVHDRLQLLRFPGAEGEERMEFLETKDYLTCDASRMKKTGWRALKSVVRWHGQLFEIQVQPLSNYYLELDHMAGPSHRSFKAERDALRLEITRRLPLYGFYRDLLRMLFMKASISFEAENASVVITD